MRIFNSLIVPKNVRGGPLGFFNIHSVAKHQKSRREDPLKTFKKFEKKSHKAEKGAEKVSVPKNWKGGTLLGFVFLDFKLEAFGCVHNQALSFFGKSA